MQPKEIQLEANPSKDARDFFIDMNDESNRLVLTESLFDALSFKEVDDKANYIALTGVQKTSKVKRYIKDHLTEFTDKKIVIAFDNDNAGDKGTKEFEEFLTKNKIVIQNLIMKQHKMQKTRMNTYRKIKKIIVKHIKIHY